MGLLGGLAKGGMFGIAGLLLSKKKKKEAVAPTAAAQATGTPTGPAAVAANTQRRDMSMASATGLENRDDAATAPRNFNDAFRERSKALRLEHRAERRALRATRRENNGGVGRFR